MGSRPTRAGSAARAPSRSWRRGPRRPGPPCRASYRPREVAATAAVGAEPSPPPPPRPRRPPRGRIPAGAAVAPEMRSTAGHDRTEPGHRVALIGGYRQAGSAPARAVAPGAGTPISSGRHDEGPAVSPTMAARAEHVAREPADATRARPGRRPPPGGGEDRDDPGRAGDATGTAPAGASQPVRRAPGAAEERGREPARPGVGHQPGPTAITVRRPPTTRRGPAAPTRQWRWPTNGAAAPRRRRYAERADVGRRHHFEAPRPIEVRQQAVGGVGEAVDVEQACEREVGRDHDRRRHAAGHTRPLPHHSPRTRPSAAPTNGNHVNVRGRRVDAAEQRRQEGEGAAHQPAGSQGTRPATTRHLVRRPPPPPD